MEMDEEINLDADEEVEEDHDVDESGDPQQMDANDGEEQHFDITIAASHSYMGSELAAVGGRTVLEAGWAGRVPALPHHSTVFPGETVPLLLTDRRDAALMAQAIAADKLFGLLFTEETHSLSGYGVLCEVFEAGAGGAGAGGAGAGAGGAGAGGAGAGAGGAGAAGDGAVAVKARALHRVRAARGRVTSRRAARVPVRVLAEQPARPPLLLARPAAPDPLRRAPLHPLPDDPAIRRLDAAVSGWPMFVYDMFDYKRMRALIRRYFDSLHLGDMLPSDPVSLSFWVSRNLSCSPRDRLALFAVDSALLRLHMACDMIAAKGGVLCCVSCGAAVARREDVFAMSSDGVHAHYTNLGGYVHDVVTVRRARNVSVPGAASREYSWFPGYAWAAAACARCGVHLGWRFTAAAPALRPAAFLALCRDYIAPRDAAREPPPL